MSIKKITNLIYIGLFVVGAFVLFVTQDYRSTTNSNKEIYIDLCSKYGLNKTKWLSCEEMQPGLFKFESPTIQEYSILNYSTDIFCNNIGGVFSNSKIIPLPEPKSVCVIIDGENVGMDGENYLGISNCGDTTYSTPWSKEVKVLRYGDIYYTKKDGFYDKLYGYVDSLNGYRYVSGIDGGVICSNIYGDTRRSGGPYKNVGTPLIDCTYVKGYAKTIICSL